MNDKINLVSYYNTNLGISILVPENWTFSIIDNSNIRLFGDFENGYKDLFEEYRPSISFQIKKTKKIIQLDKIQKYYFGITANNFNDYQIISENKEKLLGKYYFKREFSWNEESFKIKIYNIHGFIESGLNSYISFDAAVFEKCQIQHV